MFFVPLLVSFVHVSFVFDPRVLLTVVIVVVVVDDVVPVRVTSCRHASALLFLSQCLAQRFSLLSQVYFFPSSVAFLLDMWRGRGREKERERVLSSEAEGEGSRAGE